MRIYKTSKGIVIEKDQQYFLSPNADWDAFINRDDLFNVLSKELQTLQADAAIAAWLPGAIQAPVGHQEVWAAGVTYLRSRDARMDEAKESGCATFYDKVYDAERPELFFKATAQRVVGTGQQVRIRKDSSWNVPEPELTLFITSSGKIVAYTIGNDMSSRSIEGENPLYLPQAKVYEGCAALGPCLYVPASPLPPETLISIEIQRQHELMYADQTPIRKMKRTHAELAGFLFRECAFPYGCFLMTGTSLVPPNEFTLQFADLIRISIDHIGTLENTVAAS